jgi:uracil-DNA glycosylase
VGVAAPQHGDLTAWTRHGVLLLNRCLTVAPGAPGSHRGKGWEAVTDQAIRALVARGRPLVAILWGRDAQTLQPLLGSVPVVRSVHPSPLSASGGFFGSRPFSRANALLAEQGAEPVDWSLD